MISVPHTRGELSDPSARWFPRQLVLTAIGNSLVFDLTKQIIGPEEKFGACGPEVFVAGIVREGTRHP